MGIKMNNFTISIAGILIGAFVTHLYAWNIKNKIEILDKMFKSTLAIHFWFYEFLSQKSIDGSGANSTNNPKIRKIKAHYVQQMNKIIAADQSILDEYFDKEIDEFKSHIEKMFSADNYDACHFNKSSDKDLFLKIFGALTDKITKRRKELISFKYMLKQLVISRFSLVGILLIIILFLLFQCYNNTQQLTVIHYIIQNIH